MEKVKKWKLPLVSKAPWWVRKDGLLDIELWKDSIWIRIQGLSILIGSGFISCTMASKLSPASEKTFPNNRSLSPYATGMSFPYWLVQKQILSDFLSPLGINQIHKLRNFPHPEASNSCVWNGFQCPLQQQPLDYSIFLLRSEQGNKPGGSSKSTTGSG
jgi:hypothetical protein